MTLEFLHDNQTLFAFHLHGERHAAAASQIRVTLDDRLFDVLRIKIAAADDDEIFQAPGNEQLALMQKPEVAGAKERLAGHTQEPRAKDVLRLFRPLPISFRDAIARDPDLADLIRRALSCSFGINDECFLTKESGATTHQVLCVNSRSLFDAMFSQ